jgi:hypothetical protein
MEWFRSRGRLLIVSVVVLAMAVIGVGMAIPNGRDIGAAVHPYDPMPRW